LVEFLEDNGYQAAIAGLDAKRDAVQLRVSPRWTAGMAAQLEVSQSGTLLLPETFERASATKIEASTPLPVASVPALLERDRSYLPVAWRGDGAERIWAVETPHPIQFEVLPWMDENGAAIELLPKTPFAGTAILEVEDKPIFQGEIRDRTLVPLHEYSADVLPKSYHFAARSASGIEREQDGFLTVVGAPRFTGDWSHIPRIGVDDARFVPARGQTYGASRAWPGPHEYSAQLQFAWDDAAFLLRVEVCDAIHFQPYHGHFLYNADCLQLALDPLLRRRDTLGNVYSFNLALTEDGPELYRMHAPQEERSATFTPPPGDVSLGDEYLQIETVEDGLIYSLRLPWKELAPFRPAPGARLGVYYIMFNNNGSGHLDTLHWPVPISGMWMVPRRWGVLTLLDAA
jgi:hypothetical protein